MKFLSIYLGHNCTAGISINGELKFIKSEERFNRIKNCVGFPVETIRYIKKKYLNNNLSNLDKIILIDETGLGLNWINKTDFKPKKYTLDPWKFKKNKFLTKLIFLIFNIKFLSFLQKIRLKILFLIFKFFFNKKKNFI